MGGGGSAEDWGVTGGSGVMLGDLTLPGRIPVIEPNLFQSFG